MVLFYKFLVISSWKSYPTFLKQDKIKLSISIPRLKYVSVKKTLLTKIHFAVLPWLLVHIASIIFSSKKKNPILFMTISWPWNISKIISLSIFNYHETRITYQRRKKMASPSHVRRTVPSNILNISHSSTKFHPFNSP